jgi:glycosyltransferase involved in cell wall biosynthesis
MSQVVQRLLGRDDLPLHEVPVPVDLEGTRISENVRPRELQPPLIASINSCFAEDKGIDCLLQALALLRGRRDFTCVIAGTDDHPTARHRRRLDALVRALDLAGHVSFVGYLDRPDVGALLARVAVLVDARTSNNFSSVCVEAQFAACPVVAADTPGSRAILEDRENSLLFRKDDPAALAAAIEAAVVPETGAALSRGARRWREEVGRRFREDVCFGYLQQICAAVAGKGSQRQEVA